MKTRFVSAAILLFLFVLTGCGKRGDGITRTPDAHTYEGYPVVYVTPEVSPQGLLSAYELLEYSAHGNILIKLSDTETDAGFDWTRLVGTLSESLPDAVVADTAHEMNFSDYDCTIILSHFRSHENVGFNGAVKQTSIISAYSKDACDLTGSQDMSVLLAEYGKYTVDSTEGQMLYINVMDRLSIESGGIVLPDTNTYQVGIFSSYDPVALDQACVDMVYMLQEGKSLAAHIEACNGIDTLIHAEQIGMGSRTYAMSITGQ